jgi:hypothetical protein
MGGIERKDVLEGSEAVGGDDSLGLEDPKALINFLSFTKV